MLVFIVYVLGFFISLYLFQQINKTIKAKYNKIDFYDACFASLLSWFTVVSILFVTWYNQSTLKVKLKEFIENFEEGK